MGLRNWAKRKGHSLKIPVLWAAKMTPGWLMSPESCYEPRETKLVDDSTAPPRGASKPPTPRRRLLVLRS